MCTPPIKNNGFPDTRLSSLDGLRGVAILLVIGYHYFNEPGALRVSLYPYGDAFAGFPLFVYGFLGVHLFFIISGFVIALTLDKCKTPYEFFVRRFARIWPPLLVCSIITFLIIKLFPSPFSAVRKYDWSDFLPSLTLTPNELWSWHFPNVDFVDGVYWTLLVEARFYLIVAVIYWSFRRANIARNLVIFTFLNIFCRAALQRALPGSNEIYSALFVPDFMPWFAAGAVFYELYTNRIRITFAIVLLCLMIAIIFRISTFGFNGVSELNPLIISCFAILFFAMFFLIATKSTIARFFEAGPLMWVGVCSYSVYLLHYAIGMTILTSIPKGVAIASQFTLIVTVAITMITAGYLSFTYVEKPSRRFVTRIMLINRLRIRSIS